MIFHRSLMRPTFQSHHRLSECPRCGYSSFEYLNSYAHCVNCLHYQDFEGSMLPIEYSDHEFRFERYSEDKM